MATIVYVDYSRLSATAAKISRINSRTPGALAGQRGAAVQFASWRDPGGRAAWPDSGRFPAGGRGDLSLWPASIGFVNLVKRWTYLKRRQLADDVYSAAAATSTVITEDVITVIRYLLNVVTYYGAMIQDWGETISKKYILGSPL